MPEDNNKNNNNDAAEDAATLKGRLEQVENEKAAIEMKLRKSENDLYSEDYLEYLQNKNKQQAPQNKFMSGGRLTDYSDDEMGSMAVPKLVGLMVHEVYSQIKEDENKKETKKQMDERKKRGRSAKEEVMAFAKTHPDFRYYVAKIDELSEKHPTLNIEDLYEKAKREEAKINPPKEEKKTPPNTRATVEAGVRQSDKNLSLREVIAQEYQKLK